MLSMRVGWTPRLHAVLGDSLVTPSEWRGGLYGRTNRRQLDVLTRRGQSERPSSDTPLTPHDARRRHRGDQMYGQI